MHAKKYEAVISSTTYSDTHTHTHTSCYLYILYCIMWYVTKCIVIFQTPLDEECTHTSHTYPSGWFDDLPTQCHNAETTKQIFSQEKLGLKGPKTKNTAY